MKTTFQNAVIWSLLAFVTASVMGGCTSIEMSQQSRKENTFHYLALGDSYTIGESVASGERFPVQLVDSLRNYGVQMDDPLVIAKTGWTTDELLRALDERELPTDFDLVSLLIGVNNQYRGRPIDEFRQDLAKLIDKAIEYAGDRPEHVVIISIPDWGVTPFAADRDRFQIMKQIDEYNSVIRDESGLRELAFIDITADSRRAAEEPELVASDGLHPSEVLYGRWVEKLVPTVLWILASS